MQTVLDLRRAGYREPSPEGESYPFLPLPHPFLPLPQREAYYAIDPFLPQRATDGEWLRDMITRYGHSGQ